MGMPIPRSFYTQVSQESPLWDDPSGLERRVAPVSEAEGVCHERRLSAARSRAYAHLHSTQTQCGKHIGFSERKELDMVAQNIANKQRNFVGHKFWARGDFVSTVGINEKVIRAYSENQEKEDKRLDDLFDR